MTGLGDDSDVIEFAIARLSRGEPFSAVEHAEQFKHLGRVVAENLRAGTPKATLLRRLADAIEGAAEADLRKMLGMPKAATRTKDWELRRDVWDAYLAYSGLLDADDPEVIGIEQQVRGVKEAHDVFVRHAVYADNKDKSPQELEDLVRAAMFVNADRKPRQERQKWWRLQFGAAECTVARLQIVDNVLKYLRDGASGTGIPVPTPTAVISFLER